MVAGGSLGEGPRRLAALAVERLLRWLCWDQAIAATSDQVVATGLLERPPDLEVVLRLEELQEGPLRPPVTEPLRDRHRLPRHRVEPGVVHAGRDVERAGDEVLHLVGLVAVALEEHGQVDHLLQAAARVAGDEVGNRVLLLADPLAGRLEGLVELDVVVG